MLPLLPALWLLAASSGPSDMEIALKRFTTALATVEREAADPVTSRQAVYEGAIPGMLRRLDPHTVFFNPDQFQQLKDMEQSTRKGFGSVVSVLPGRVIVLQTLAGTPSARVGLSAGDEILAINGIALAQLDMEQLVGLLGESRQKEARLDVRRLGSARLLQFMLTPEDMLSPSVERAFLVRPGVGYVRVASFDDETGKQLREAVEKLGGGKLRALVLDLRNNPGGVVPAALDTAALFLKPGQRILTVRGRAVQGKEEKVPEGATPYTFPLAVLINQKTASASEIVSGALQDHDRAVIVGEPSFGKGLVQSVFPLTQGTGLALTTAFYYTPSGRSIQRPLKTGQLEDHAGPAKEYRTDSGRVVRGGGGIDPDQAALPEEMTRLRMVIEASASLPNFALEYTGRHKGLTESFEVDGALLDEFQSYLAERRIQPNVAEWSSDREWIRSRLKEEIINQAFGVAKGDEVAAQRDPQVAAALGALGVR
jgi:carboxyl-terminal processing protease